MRLVNTTTLDVDEFLDHELPSSYAILSHTWGKEEVTLQDVRCHTAAHKHGYRKIKAACALAKEHGFSHIWIDTCGIDKTSSAELSEAINSMFRYYAEAEVCFVLLEDYEHTNIGRFHQDFARCRWFTRGWTLQELIAPQSLKFFNAKWECLGTKVDLAAPIAEITGIQIGVLSGRDSFLDASVATRFSWAATRQTTRREDMAYCLLGIFDVNMPLLYGEGDKAFLRLQEMIMQLSNDHSLFAWQRSGPLIAGGQTQFPYWGMLASHPSQFVYSRDVVATNHSYGPYSLTNQGLHMRLPIIKDPDYDNRYTAILSCRFQNDYEGCIGIQLSPNAQGGNNFTRLDGYTISGRYHVKENALKKARVTEIYVSQNSRSTNARSYLWIRSKPAEDSGFEICHWDAYPQRMALDNPQWDQKAGTLAFVEQSCMGTLDIHNYIVNAHFKVHFRIEGYAGNFKARCVLNRSRPDEESLSPERLDDWGMPRATNPSTQLDDCHARLLYRPGQHLTASLTFERILGDDVAVLDITTGPAHTRQLIYWSIESLMRTLRYQARRSRSISLTLRGWRFAIQRNPSVFAYVGLLVVVTLLFTWQMFRLLRGRLWGWKTMSRASGLFAIWPALWMMTSALFRSVGAYNRLTDRAKTIVEVGTSGSLVFCLSNVVESGSRWGDMFAVWPGTWVVLTMICKAVPAFKRLSQHTRTVVESALSLIVAYNFGRMLQYK